MVRAGKLKWTAGRVSEGVESDRRRYGTSEASLVSVVIWYELLSGNPWCGMLRCPCESVKRCVTGLGYVRSGVSIIGCRCRHVGISGRWVGGLCKVGCVSNRGLVSGGCVGLNRLRLCDTVWYGLRSSSEEISNGELEVSVPDRGRGDGPDRGGLGCGADRGNGCVVGCVLEDEDAEGPHCGTGGGSVGCGVGRARSSARCRYGGKVGEVVGC